MAKGNNGNLLQHYVECELAARLTEGMIEKRLHAVFTHGMGPFEKTEPLPPGEPDELRRLLKALPTLEEDSLAASGFAVLGAYKRLGASAERYPNSAELVSAVLGDRSALSGSICENDAALALELKSAWKGSNVVFRPGSWRDALRQHLNAPDGLQGPWLFSMDPYSFVTRDFLEVKDDGNLDHQDLESLPPVVSSYFNRSHRGCLCIFTYGVHADQARLFKGAMTELCTRLGDEVSFELASCFLSTASRDGAEHIGALMAEDAELIEKIRDGWSGCLQAARIFGVDPAEQTERPDQSGSVAD